MGPPIKLCVVNRNYPPDQGPTGEEAAQLISWLRAYGQFEISVVSVSKEESLAAHLRVRRRYNGKNKFRRLISSILEGLELVIKSKRLNADTYIILTDPPFLNLWASIFLRKKIWLLWVMDIYPDAFVANQLVSRKNIFFRIYRWILKRYPPNQLICLGEQQAEFLKEIYFPGIATHILPAGVKSELDEMTHSGNQPIWYQENYTYWGYIGSVGEAHDADFLIALIRSLDPASSRFVLSCSGVKSTHLKDAVRDLEAVVFLDRIPDKEMKLIDIQVVSLLHPWTHICVPSKALSALCFGSAVVFHGRQDSDTWQYVQEAGWLVETKSGIVTFIEGLSESELKKKKSKTDESVRKLREVKKRAYHSIASFLESSHQ